MFMPMICDTIPISLVDPQVVETKVFEEIMLAFGERYDII